MSDAAASGRNLSADQVGKVAKGRVWSGEQAFGHKWVDKLGDLHTAIELAKSEIGMADQEIPVQVFPAPRSMIEQLLDLFRQDPIDDFSGWSRASTFSTLSPIMAMVHQMLTYFNTKTIFAIYHVPDLG